MVKIPPPTPFPNFFFKSEVVIKLLVNTTIPFENLKST